jgi:uncharacterized protein YerC
MSAAKSTKKRKPTNLAKPEAKSAKAINASSAVNAKVPYFAFKTRTRTVDKDGKEILFNLRKGQNQTEIYEFFKDMIVSNEGIQLADDGIYTWILIASDKDPYGELYAAKTISMQEIGTLHKNLYDTMTKLKPVIVAAGEFDKRGKKITFNLLSGTFMEPKVKGKNSPTRKAIMQSAAKSITDKFTVYPLDVEETPKNILANANIRTSPKTIAEFNRLFNRGNAANA